MIQNKYSHLTAKHRDKLSFPTRLLFQNNKLFNSILDFGCGLGSDVMFLKEKGFDVDGYDPYYFPKYPHKKYDVIYCNYVLNVLQNKEQATVLFEISKLLKKGGKAYFAVRRDLKKNGFRLHHIHKVKTYQTNVVLPFKTFFKNGNMELYEYESYCEVNEGKATVSPFFSSYEPKVQVGEIGASFAFRDKFPVSKGHTLVLPKRLVSNYFDLSFKEQSSCWFLVNLVKNDLIKEFNPDGFNIGINVDRAAGQTVYHCHIHVIPRYKNDVKEPSGGVRGVIPNKQKY